jgi:hypothetical protein
MTRLQQIDILSCVEVASTQQVAAHKGSGDGIRAVGNAWTGREKQDAPFVR